MKIKYKTCSMLLTGDAKGVTTDEVINSSINKIKTLPSRDAELLEEYKSYTDSPTKEDKFKFVPDQDADYKATILLTSHHGSHSERSNSTKWIYSVKPKVALISAGKFPRYNHPSQLVFNRLEHTDKAPYILSVTKHPFSYFEGVTFRRDQQTSRAIFNTFNAGDVKIMFFEEGRVGFFQACDSTGQVIGKTDCFDFSGSPKEKTSLAKQAVDQLQHQAL